MALSTGNNNNLAVLQNQAALSNIDILNFINLHSTLKQKSIINESLNSFPSYLEPSKRMKTEAVPEVLLTQARFGEGLLAQNSDSVLRIPQYLAGTQQHSSVFIPKQMSNNLAVNLQNAVQSNNMVNSLLLQNKYNEIQKAIQQSAFERQQSLQNRNLGLINCSNKIIQNTNGLMSMPQFSQLTQLFPASGKIQQPCQNLPSEVSSVEKILAAQNFIFQSSLANQVNVKRRRERSSSPERHQESTDLFAKKMTNDAKVNFFKSHEKILDMETSSTSSKTAETTSESLSPLERSERPDIKFLAEEFQGLTQQELDEFIIALEKKVDAKVVNKKRIVELLSKFNNCTKQILENVRKNKSYYRTQLC